MKRTIQVLPVLFILVMLAPSCGERRSEQAKGIETELAGDEPDERPPTGEQDPGAYNPADTVVNIRGDELPPDLLEFSQVLVTTYLDLEETLVQDNPEEAKEKAEQMDKMLLRHEQENLELSPDVKHLFTNTTHILRQSAQSILEAQDLGEIKALFSAMAPAAYKLAKVSALPGTNLYYQFCAASFDNRGAYWLSRTKEIRNPYEGQTKQGCGKTIAVL